MHRPYDGGVGRGRPKQVRCRSIVLWVSALAAVTRPGRGALDVTASSANADTPTLVVSQASTPLLVTYPPPNSPNAGSAGGSGLRRKCRSGPVTQRWLNRARRRSSVRNCAAGPPTPHRVGLRLRPVGADTGIAEQLIFILSDYADE